MSDMPKADELFKSIDYAPPTTGWMETPVDFSPGNWCYPAKPETMEYMESKLPGLWGPAREWNPGEADWKLPANWKETVVNGFRERLDKFRSVKLFMDICVRCGACADKCHYFIGSGDPKNMPVLRAELMRSIYRGEFTLAGKILTQLTGSRVMEEDVLKEWFIYFYQCTECRRCSLFCPYGIDTAEITMMARELMHLVGLGTHWIMDPVSNCNRTGNHLGIQPHAFADIVEFMVDDIEEVTGKKVKAPLNEHGHDILFITPSGDAFADPGIYTFMGYLTLFDHLDLDYTMSTYASEGGNFGSFTNNETMKKLNAKMYHEANRLGCKWILGGECGHMWRVVHQYMDTMNGDTQGDQMETPVNPITGTVFETAAATKMVHITEFTADLIKHGKLNLDKSRNDHLRVTYHDSCNPARGMGLLDEPRYVIESVCNNFFDMPVGTIREQTFCCAGGSGLNTEEILEIRLRGGLPRGNALKYVQDEHQVNTLACICAIDRATLIPLADYWAPGVTVCGTHELVANALVLEEGEERTMDFRLEALPGFEDEDDDWTPPNAEDA